MHIFRFAKCIKLQNQSFQQVKRDQVKKVKQIYKTAHGRVQKEIWLLAIGLAFGHKVQLRVL